MHTETEFIQNIPKEYNYQSLQMKREHKSTKSNIDCKPLFYFYYPFLINILFLFLMSFTINNVL